LVPLASCKAKVYKLHSSKPYLMQTKMLTPT